MNETACRYSQRGFLRLQSWYSPAFPTGAFGYSHGVEWAVQSQDVRDREGLIEWLQADLRHGSGRNEAIFFAEAWRCTVADDAARLLEVAELAAAYRATFELALEASQQGSAALSTLRQVWPERVLERLAGFKQDLGVAPTLAVVLGARSAREGLPMSLALPAFLQAHVANLVSAGVRLIPLGQTDGQVAVSRLEETVLDVAAVARDAALEDLGSAAFMLDLSSMAHETQYTRLYRS